MLKFYVVRIWECDITEESKNKKDLGQILSSDGPNTQNITNLANKGRGMVNTITNILNSMSGGKYHFELAVIFRNAYLISSMLSCSKVLYHLSEGELRKQEHVDISLIRKSLDWNRNHDNWSLQEVMQKKNKDNCFSVFKRKETKTQVSKTYKTQWIING